MNSWDVVILSYLYRKDWTDPDIIAKALRSKHMTATWARPKCKRLVRKKLLERDSRGWYRMPEKMYGVVETLIKEA